MAVNAGLDTARIKKDFPILDREINGMRLVYLDSAATSQKPRTVIDAEVAFLTNENAAVHRGAHTLAAEATELFEDARATVAGFVGAEPEQLVWTIGATAGLNHQYLPCAEAIEGALLGVEAAAVALKQILAPRQETQSSGGPDHLRVRILREHALDDHLVQAALA